MYVPLSGAVLVDASTTLDDFAKSHPQSPSSIDTYRDCQRKWAWNKLDKIKKPPNKYAQRGTDVHNVLESWLRDGIPIPQTDAGKIALAGVRHLPLPKTGLVEGGGKLFSFAGSRAVYQGKKDWRTYGPAPFLVGGSNVGLVRVFDHKSTTDFKWAKRAEELRKDVQSNLYAVHEIACLTDPSAEPVIEENWVYYRANPKKPGSMRVVLNVVPDGVPMVLPVPDGVGPGYFGMMQYSELWQRFEEIESDAAEMLDHIRNQRKAKQLPYNIETCNKYGGCPYRGNPCKLSMSEIIRGHMEQEKKGSIADKIRAQLAQRKAAAGSNGAAEASTTAAAPAKQDASAEGKAVAAAPLSSGSAAAVQGSPPAVNPPQPANKQQSFGEFRDSAIMVSTTAAIAQGIVASRIYNEGTESYANDVAKLSAKVARAIVTEITSA